MKKAATALKTATQLYGEGRFDKAIAILAPALGTIARGPVGYKVDVFLRLPRYLHAAGRIDEAQQELRRLYQQAPVRNGVVNEDHPLMGRYIRLDRTQVLKCWERLKLGAPDFLL